MVYHVWDWKCGLEKGVLMLKRVEQLRTELKKQELSAYLIPSEDPHQSEYPPACWLRRSAISGFTGSAGEAVITEEDAALWTDSRYFLQAASQLEGSGFNLMKMGLPGTPSIREWLRDNLKQGDRVGVDPRVMTHLRFISLANYLNRFGIQLVEVQENLVDRVWDNQPVLPTGSAVEHPLQWAGRSVRKKLTDVRQQLDGAGADAHVLSALDSIAWLFNIRGSDVEFNPVVVSYALVEQDRAVLYVNPDKIGAELGARLKEDGVTIASYEQFGEELQSLTHISRILLDRTTVSQWIVSLLPDNVERIMGDSPVTLMKACKNESELEGMRQAHRRDGAAMVRFLRWLEKAVPEGGVTEISASDKLASFREELDRYVGPSFAPISGYREHGAIIHYSATSTTDVELKPEGLYLIDSGGQYLDGTTDITRTVTLGKPHYREQEMFTRVLKGHIMLSMTRFPEGTPGRQLDTVSRLPLWEIGQTFMHGTGHGVGAYLNVHEGPQAISYYRCTGVPLMTGMVVSNEPGYYEAGEFGIRVENLVYVIPDADTEESELPFLRFENLTLCPIDRRLVLEDMLSQTERAYLNSYHARVFEELSPLLDGEDKKWLHFATAPI